MKPSWTAERLQVLTDLWLVNTPVVNIAIALGNVFNKNQIIGKAHRLNLPRHAGHPGTIKLEPKPAPKFHPNINHRPATVPLIDLPSTPASDLDIPKYRRKKLIQLGPRHCRFPVGDPRDKNFFFCGAMQYKANAYCLEHCRRAYTYFQA